MTKAFQCERCEEFNKGSGAKSRVGEYEGTIKREYNFWHQKELCENCKAKLKELADRFFEGEENYES